MATFSQNGVQFTALAGTALPSKYGNGENGIFDDAGTDGVAPFINSVEIDWNEAQLGAAIQALNEVPDNEALYSTTITTTGELIQVIAKQQKQIDALIVMMKALYGTFTQP